MLGSVVAYSILRRADRTGAQVLQSHRALEAAEETLRRALDAENGVARFVVTGDRADLAPFERAEQLMPRVLDDLQEHVEGDAERRRVGRLRSEVDALFVSAAQNSGARPSQSRAGYREQHTDEPSTGRDPQRRPRHPAQRERPVDVADDG